MQTTLRPDIVLWSNTGKKLIVIELTVPWETRCENAHDRQKAKYTELLDLCKEKGWRTWLFPVEVCVRGFCSQSVCRLMTAVGTTEGYPETKRSSRTGVKLAVAETRGDELEAISQRAVIDHHYGPTRHQSVHGIGPKHSTMAASMLMMLVEEQSVT